MVYFGLSPVKEFKMSHSKILLLTLGLFAMAACTNPTVPDPDMTDTEGSAESGADTDVYGNDGRDDGSNLAAEDLYAGELATTIYFDFDSSEVRADDIDIIARHAVQISDDMRVSVRLEGHADERGTREYNIALGARRAAAVVNYLVSKGVSANRLSSKSFGKERPVAICNDISCWSQNRRSVTVLN